MRDKHEFVITPIVLALKGAVAPIAVRSYLSRPELYRFSVWQLNLCNSGGSQPMRGNFDEDDPPATCHGLDGSR